MFKKLDDIEFKAFVSKKHLLASRKGSLPIEELLGEKFVTTDPSFFGAKSSNYSVDGWRDDKFRRDETISTNSLKCLESLLMEGLAIAYLPEYYGNSLGLKPINISNCPYTCRQQIYLGRSKYSLESLWSII
jgi:DNA-binding transcriptional LysR family regulator